MSTHLSPAAAWHDTKRHAWRLSGLFPGLACLWVPPFLLLRAAYGASLLEVANDTEHYGPLRQPGERCAPEHSWNSNHHAHPARCYQAMRHFDSAPQLPAGYAGLLVLAGVPPLWFRLMDPACRPIATATSLGPMCSRQGVRFCNVAGPAFKSREQWQQAS